MTRVARFHADRTNQKLYFARLACQQAEHTDHVQHAQAHVEATVFHLQGAVLAFLQELGRYYRLQDTQPTLSSIEQSMAAKGQVSPEITVLKTLAQNGFLAELTAAYQAVQYAPEPQLPQAEDELSSNLIMKASHNSKAWLPDSQTLREWHQKLTELIDGFRNEMMEF